MHANALKALPIALLLTASTSLFAASGDSPEKKETTIVVAGDNLPDGDESFVWTFPGRAGQGRLGVRLVEMTPELRAHYGAPRDAGVLVAQVETGSPAEKAGLRAGDIITRAGGEHVENAADLVRAVRHAKVGDSLKLEISRDRAATQVTVKVERQRGYEYEIDLGDLGRGIGRDIGRGIGRNIGRDIGRDFGRDLRREIGREIGRHAWAFRDGPIVFRDRRVLRDRPENLDRLQDKLEEMEKRLRDLEKKLPR
jgi:membrane-associated protease RseP (regulator of RpoE activity)